MSDLKKLLDEGDDFERSLLGAASDQAEDRAREERTLAALGLGGPPPVPDGGGGAIGAALGKGLFVVTLGGVVIAGAIALRSDPAQAPEPLPRPLAPAVVASAPKPAIEPSPPAKVVEVPTPSSSRASARPQPTAPKPGDPSTLGREIAALDRARAALRAGDTERARAELDRYDRDFPFGSLGPEARALRARVNKKSGSEKK